MKSLDQKLARIAAGNATSKDFIIADAKDADMAFGIQENLWGQTLLTKWMSSFKRQDGSSGS